MFTLGYEEMMLVAIVALIVVGPEKLPDLARKLGAAMTMFKRMANDFARQIETAESGEDLTKKISPWPPYPAAKSEECLPEKSPSTSINRQSSIVNRKS